jgi:hypothetical protein
MHSIAVRPGSRRAARSGRSHCPLARPFQHYFDSLWHDQITIGTKNQEPRELPARPVDPLVAAKRRKTMWSLSAQLLGDLISGHGNLPQ